MPSQPPYDPADPADPANPDAPDAPPAREPSRPYGVRPYDWSPVRKPGEPMDPLAPRRPDPEPEPGPAVDDDGGPGPFDDDEGPGPSVDDDMHRAIMATAPPPAPVRAPAPVPGAGPEEEEAEDEDDGLPPDPGALKPRHETFCRHYVFGGSAKDAAVACGYTYASAANQGYRLLRRRDVRRRLAEIRRALVAGHRLDAEVLLGKLEALYEHASAAGNFHAAARLVELQARIAGHVEGGRRVLSRAAAEVPAGPDDEK